jgi:hypothetical protein
MKCSSPLGAIIGIGLLLTGGTNAYADPAITKTGPIDVTWFPVNPSQITIDFDNISAIQTFSGNIHAFTFIFSTNQPVDISSGMIQAASEGSGAYEQLTITAPNGFVFNHVKFSIILADGASSIEISGSGGGRARIVGLNGQQFFAATGDFTSLTIRSSNGISQIKDIEISGLMADAPGPTAGAGLPGSLRRPGRVVAMATEGGLNYSKCPFRNFLNRLNLLDSKEVV